MLVSFKNMQSTKDAIAIHLDELNQHDNIMH